MALYHKHRPQTFSSVVGQDHIIETLKNQILQDKVAHAYLFSGPRGVGKTTTARLLAKAVNCPRKKGSAEPDNESPEAKEINESRSIDVIEIDAASHTGVDNVRQNIIENAQFKPTKLPYKVFIIDEVHMLSTAAFNALLKTLEEPPAHVIFILATTELHKLPVTIVSRCQRFAFKTVPKEVIINHLQDIAQQEDVTVDQEVLARIAKKSEGCVRDAISLFDQAMAVGGKKITTDTVQLILPRADIELQLDFLAALAKKDTQAALSLISALVQSGASLTQFAAELGELARACMMHAINKDIVVQELDFTKDHLQRIEEITNTVDPKDMVTLIDLINTRSQQIKTAPLPQLPLELVVVAWTGETGTVPTTPPKQEALPEETVVEQKNSAHSASGSPPPAEKKTSISHEDIMSSWTEALQKIDAAHTSLGFIVKSATIQSMSENTLTLEVPYTFHQERLMARDSKSHIESILNSVYDSTIEIVVVVSEGAQEPISEELQNLASAFGGEVIT